MITVSFNGGGNRRTRRKPPTVASHSHLALIEIRTHNISGDSRWLHM